MEGFSGVDKEGFGGRVEVWDNERDEVVGGVYGVRMGKVFMGERMLWRVG